MRKATVTCAALAVVLVAAAPGSAGAACFNKASEGTGGDVEGAKFQAFEAILQSFSWGTWASWMTTGQTPGYKITTKYKCKSGTGLGVTCRANSRICPK
ncbi:MAG: hypothetical protein GC150_15590 [Rhizobiales bacterium]|nr:hypothetical protein [Hyphomicrobiales bacterium]